jgi:hypothetical protein
MPADTDIATSLTKLASDYGPFLFAILFALIVPVRTYQNFRDCTTKFPAPNEFQRDLIRESEMYFRYTWIAGFVLIAFSVAWWLYLNYDIQRLRDSHYYVRYNAVISNVSANDELDISDQDAYLYFVNTPYPHYQFVLLRQNPVSSVEPFVLNWLDRRQAPGQSGLGGQFVTLVFDPKQQNYTLRRDATQLPTKVVAVPVVLR